MYVGRYMLATSWSNHRQDSFAKPSCWEPPNHYKLAMFCQGVCSLLLKAVCNAELCYPKEMKPVLKSEHIFTKIAEPKFKWALKDNWDFRETEDGEQERTPHRPLSWAREAWTNLNHLNGAEPSTVKQSGNKVLKTLNRDWKFFRLKLKRALAFWRPMFIQTVLKWMEF